MWATWFIWICFPAFLNWFKGEERGEIEREREFWGRKIKKSHMAINDISPDLLRSRRSRPFDVLVRRTLKWKKMFSYYLIQSEREAGGGLHWAPPWQSPLCWVYPPLSHTLIRLSFSLIETPPQWHSIRAAEWKPGYFYIFFPPRLGRGPSKGINQCSLTALPSGNDLSLFFLCPEMTH